MKTHTLRNTKTTLLTASVLFVATLLLSATYYFHSTVSANSTTFNVVAGNDSLAGRPGECTLSKALQNIDDQAQTNQDCPTPGSNNTIQLPEGTVTLTADLPVVTQPYSIAGQGMGASIIDGTGQYSVIAQGQHGGTAEFSDFTVSAFSSFGFFVANIDTAFNNIEIDGTNATSDDFVALGANGVMTGISAFSEVGDSRTVTANNVYIHSFTGDASTEVFGGLSIMNSNLNAKNVTLADINTGPASLEAASAITLTTSPGPGVGNLQVSFENLTIDNYQAPNIEAGTGAIAFNALSMGGESSAEVSIKNSTITASRMTNGYVPLSAAIAVGYAAIGEESTVNVDFEMQNVILVDNINNTEQANRSCGTLNVNDIFGEPEGQINISTTSLGGNFSDDNTCSEDFFTHSTDQNNVTNLKDTLNPLALNGGTIPSIAPKPGSPVIDAGICDGAPTTDIRGVSRPQGLSCDSGAVEVKQASVTNPTTGIPSAQPSKRIFMDPIAPGVVLSQATIIENNDINDQGFDYPYGMLAFTAEGVDEGSTHTINLYFESDEPAEQFVARKHNPNTDEHFTIEDATLTNEERDGTPVIKVTYPITDGGDLDIDGQENGILTDPVGLAKQQDGVLATTGIITALAVPMGLLLIFGASYTYIDYRRHKKPLLQADASLARSYTYWHHLRVVSIPLARYRMTIHIERKQTLATPDVE